MNYMKGLFRCVFWMFSIGIEMCRLVVRLWFDCFRFGWLGFFRCWIELLELGRFILVNWVLMLCLLCLNMWKMLFGGIVC